MGRASSAGCSLFVCVCEHMWGGGGGGCGRYRRYCMVINHLEKLGPVVSAVDGWGVSAVMSPWQMNWPCWQRLAHRLSFQLVPHPRTHLTRKLQVTHEETNSTWTRKQPHRAMAEPMQAGPSNKIHSFDWLWSVCVLILNTNLMEYWEQHALTLCCGGSLSGLQQPSQWMAVPTNWLMELSHDFELPATSKRNVNTLF